MRLTPTIATTRTLGLAIAVAATAAIAVGPAAGAARSPQPHVSKVTVAVAGTKLTVSGRVTVSPNTARQRQRTRVRLTLTSRTGRTDQRTAKLNAQRYFGATWSTKLTGGLTLTVRVTVGGKAVGKAVTRRLTVTDPNAVQRLVGTFKLDAGAAPSGRAPTGSYFEMLTGSGSPLPNLSSPAANKNYTPFTPGTDGGLRTDRYQPAPAPAFAQGNSGGALASAIIRPVPFFSVNFSVVTGSTDAQLGVHDALPVITAQHGALTGKLSAWVAQWNGQSFNQGTPKPDGTLPSPTTRLSGTYNATTHAFTLTWKSRIVGGPFNGFTGSWHLAGTFVPARS